MCLSYWIALIPVGGVPSRRSGAKAMARKHLNLGLTPRLPACEFQRKALAILSDSS